MVAWFTVVVVDKDLVVVVEATRIAAAVPMPASIEAHTKQHLKLIVEAGTML
jgi:hypothetical protein